MKIKKFDVKYMQDGGAVPVEAQAAQQASPAPTQGGEEQMIRQLAQVAQQIIQEFGPDAAAMLAQIIMEMLQGGGQPQEVGAQPQEVGFQRKGGKICKKACGGKSVRK